MPEYIAREALLSKAQLAYRIALSEDDINSGKYSKVTFTDNFAVDLDDIVDAATVDAVEVVHCGECEHRIFVEVGDVGQIGGCEIFGCAMQNSSFCSYGKRKENT